MTVYLVGAGPGDPGLLTRRGAELLGRADVVVHDRLVPMSLLALVPGGALVIDAGKRPGRPRRQDEVNALLVEHGRAGRTVVRLKGGDPFVFGRGGEEAKALAEAGVPFEVVPGVSAAAAVPAYAGVPVTHRGLSTSVTVVTGHVGDDATEGVDWKALAAVGGTLVILMGMEHRGEIAARLMAGGRAPDTPVVVVQRGTTAGQRVARTVLCELEGVGLGSPATVVVGAVAGLDLAWFTPGPLVGTSVVVTREPGRAGGLAAALEAAGATVQLLPVVETDAPADSGAALRRAMARVGEFDWLVFTSATGVGRALDSLPDVRALAGVRLAAVGPATAAALRERRLVVDVVAEPATADGLVRSMPAAAPGRRGRAVLYPRAEEARPTLVEGLEERGWTVEEVVAYRTVDTGARLPADALDEASGADVVTFTSPSTVRAYLAAAGERPVPPVVACIGPVTAEAARRAGLEVTVVSADQSVEGLVRALIAERGAP